ncbi:hypothetical protein TNCT_386951 [Trichonephila clavata]|uniref:Uncharacterized protein n=1 Tax=Trichonephila clavata TaxID=2740835 RepID=A0A8X6KKT9_TRICU|nr:hypothetical protein TNCT_386951 [Trichonephila clavata]
MVKKALMLSMSSTKDCSCRATCTRFLVYPHKKKQGVKAGDLAGHRNKAKSFAPIHSIQRDRSSHRFGSHELGCSNEEKREGE